jgi:cyclophilin family peptidyl-prolyl cis-trans isomerase
MTHAIIATELGDIEVDLFATDAPKAAQNFVDLAGKGFYDDVIFHRVIPGFVIQGGDGEYGKKSSLNAGRVGTGGPGYKFADEPIAGDYHRGTLAMANAGPNTNGSQFFICHQDLVGKLPKNYTIFGQVTKGNGHRRPYRDGAPERPRPARRASRDDVRADPRGRLIPARAEQGSGPDC